MMSQTHLDPMGPPLEKTDDQAFARSLMMASDDDFNKLIFAMQEMRAPVSYSGQDYDRTARMLTAKTQILKIGRMPIRKPRAVSKGT